MDKITLRPLLKYTGNKYKEYFDIKEYLPEKINNYYEPFFGGGGVFFQLHNENKVCGKSFINDLSFNLMDFYKHITDDELVDEIEKISNAWNNLLIISDEIEKIYGKTFNDCIYDSIKTDIFIGDEFINKVDNLISVSKTDIYKEKNISLLKYIPSNIISKAIRFHKKYINGKLLYDDTIVNRCIQTAICQSFYNMIRDNYNIFSDYSNEIEFTEYEQLAQWYFIRNYCFGGMFRYSKDGMFNVPYGGYSYNRKSIDSKIKMMRSDSLKNLFSNNVIVHNEDYKRFLKCRFKENDFIFLDPPYDTTFSEYDMNEFTTRQHEELCETIKSLKCNWMLIIQKTPFMEKLYKDFDFIEYDKKYKYKAKGEYNNEVKHIIIKNY